MHVVIKTYEMNGDVYMTYVKLVNTQVKAALVN